MKFTLVVGLAALSLCACQPSPSPAPAASAPPATVACAVTADAMYGLEAAYNVPAHAYVTADASGVLTPAIKGQVKPLLVSAYDGLKKARLFYSARDAVGFCKSSAEVTTNAAAASRLIPK